MIAHNYWKNTGFHKAFQIFMYYLSSASFVTLLFFKIVYIIVEKHAKTLPLLAKWQRHTVQQDKTLKKLLQKPLSSCHLVSFTISNKTPVVSEDTVAWNALFMQYIDSNVYTIQLQWNSHPEVYCVFLAILQ